MISWSQERHRSRDASHGRSVGLPLAGRCKPASRGGRANVTQVWCLRSAETIYFTRRVSAEAADRLALVQRP